MAVNQHTQLVQELINILDNTLEYLKAQDDQPTIRRAIIKVTNLHSMAQRLLKSVMKNGSLSQADGQRLFRILDAGEACLAKAA